MNLGHVVACKYAHAAVGVLLSGDKSDGVKSGHAVAVIDGALDDASSETDVGWIDDASLAINDEVVSEVRHNVATRLMSIIFTV